MLIQGSVGQPSTTSIPAGTTPTMRQGQLGDVIVSELHGRFYEQVYRGNVFSVGASTTAFTANHAALTATGTPILGIWNPATSSANMVLLQAGLQIFPNNLTSGAAPGPLVWAWSVGNTAVSTGVTPWNRKTLAAAGSQAKGFAGATAMTGLTTSLVVQEGADLSNVSALTYTTLGSTLPMASVGGVQNMEGSIIVPPGGMLGLFCTTTPTTWSFAGRLMWEEVPL